MTGDSKLPSNSISAAVIVRNEDAVLERCLRSLDGVVDEIVLVHDGPCEDGSLEIAQRHGCRVFTRPLVGNPEHQTVFAYEQCRGDWLLNVDGDEYLSDELRAELRSLVRRPGVNGYEFLWRMWDGRRHLTDNGPFKLVLFRREATQMVGLLQGQERVDGAIDRSMLELEHRPVYNNFALSTLLTKWRRWARIQARAYLSDFADVPKFNYHGPDDWSAWRKAANFLAPLLFVPYALATFAFALYSERSYYAPRENVKFAAYQGIYAGMVQFYVAKFRCLR